MSPTPVDDAGPGFTVRLANFEGPFDLLLQLIGKHKLDVTEVALSVVTDDFIAHIRRNLAAGSRRRRERRRRPDRGVRPRRDHRVPAGGSDPARPEGGTAAAGRRGRGRGRPRPAGRPRPVVRPAPAVPGLQADGRHLHRAHGHGSAPVREIGHAGGAARPPAPRRLDHAAAARRSRSWPPGRWNRGPRPRSGSHTCTHPP